MFKVNDPKLCERHRHEELSWKNPIHHRHQEPSRANLIGHEMPFSDGSTRSNSVQYHLNTDLSGPRLEYETALDAKVHAPRLCKRHRHEELSRTNSMHPRHQELSWRNPLREMSSSDGSTRSNSVQYQLNRDISRPCLEHESARYYKVHAPRLFDHHRTQELPWTNPIDQRHQELSWTNPIDHRHQELSRTNRLGNEMPFSDGPRRSNSDKYHLNTDLSGLCLERERALIAKRHITEMKEALVEKDLENLQTKINYLQKEMKTSELLAMLQTENYKKCHAVELYHLGSPINREDKRSCVHIWQTSGQIRPEMSHARLEIKRPEDDTENIRKSTGVKVETEGTEVSEPQKSKLQKKWLEESIQKLRSVGSQASPQNLQEWFQASIANFKEKGTQASKQNLQQWLEITTENLQEKCPQASRKDVKEWLEISLRNIQEESPDATTLNVEEWLEKSMKSIQDLQKRSFGGSTEKVQEDLPEDPEKIRPTVSKLPTDHLKKVWLDASIGKLCRGGSEKSRQNVLEGLQAVYSKLSKKGPQASKQNLQEWLEASIQNLQEECPEQSIKDVKEWLEISRNYLQQEGPETSKLSVEEWLKTSMRSIQDLQKRSFEGSTQNIQDLPEGSEKIRPKVPKLPTDHLKKGWLDASIGNLCRGGSEKSKQNVLEGFQAVLSKLSKKSPEASKQNLQEWLEATIQNLQEECPEQSIKDVKEWLEISRNYLQQEGPETSKLSVEEWLKTSMRSIQDLQKRSFEGSTQNVQEDLPEDSEQKWLKVPELSRDHLQKGWLEASLENLQRSGSKAFRSNVQEWLQASMTKLRSSPEIVKQNLKKWLEASIKNLSEEYPEYSIKDIKEWLEVSLSYLQKKDPETSKLNVEEWLRKSLSGIQEPRSLEASREHLQVGECESSKTGVRRSMERTSLLEQSLERPSGNVHEWYRSNLLEASREPLQVGECEASKTGVRRSMESTSLLEESLERPSGNVHEWYRSNLLEGSYAASEQNVGKWLQLSSDVNICGRSSKTVLDWLSESGSNSEEEHLETSRRPTAESLVKSRRDLKGEGLASSTLCVRGGLSASIPKVRTGASRLRVEEWLESSRRSLEVAGTEASKQSLQQWLEESLGTLDEKCPANSRHDVQEWLQASLRQLEEPSVSKHSAQEWIEASLKSLKEEYPKIPIREVVECLQEEASRQSILEWLEASLIKLQEEDPESSRDNVEEWLESSLSKLRAVRPETSGHYVKEWLERSLQNLHSPKQNLQEYMKASLMNLRIVSFAPSRSRYNMDGIKVPTGARESRGILKHGSSRAHFDRCDVSRLSLIPEGNKEDYEQEEAPEISKIFMTPQIGVKGKWLHDQLGSNMKKSVAKISNAFYRYRKPFMIFLIVIPILLIALAFIYYRWYCSSCRGPRPT